MRRSTRFVVARYGNVLASRGSVIPLFHEQIAHGGPVTVTTPEMTRFLLSLDEAVDTVFAALRDGQPGETYVPRVPAARMVDVAAALIGDREIEIEYIGIRPGREDPRDPGLRGGGAADARPRRLPRDPRRCCPSCGPTTRTASRSRARVQLRATTCSTADGVASCSSATACWSSDAAGSPTR